MDANFGDGLLRRFAVAVRLGIRTVRICEKPGSFQLRLVAREMTVNGVSLLCLRGDVRPESGGLAITTEDSMGC
jgi:hypothetical protein